VTLNRADRDVSVHPSTRLPGTAQIERDITERIRSGEKFAVCYADLDHFKEFNDRYGYNRGDGVIGIVSRMLRDMVRAYAPTGFIGHIGGDDFIFNVPLEPWTSAARRSWRSSTRSCPTSTRRRTGSGVLPRQGPAR
jgi:diguanylate cyclase (GGDEF)-like protein